MVMAMLLGSSVTDGGEKDARLAITRIDKYADLKEGIFVFKASGGGCWNVPVDEEEYL
jgi:hypothetical protein